MDLNWSALFGISTSPVELVVRGTAVYWFLFALFRFVLRRDVSALGIADVLLVVLIADASQNAMDGGYQSISEGFILVGTIALWNYAVDRAAYRWPAFGKRIEPPPLLLIRNGRLCRPAMRREMISIDELKAKLRSHGIERFSDVARAYMESDGEITVIRPEDSADAAGRKRR